MKFSALRNELFKPVKKYPIQMFFLAFVLWIPETFATDFVLFIKLLVRGVLGNAFMPIAIAFLICFCANQISKLNEKIGLSFIVIFHILFYALFFLELFLNIFFDSHINANILQMIEETNGQETSEFFQTYLLTKKFGLICFFIFGLVVTEIILLKSFVFQKIVENGYAKNFLSAIILISITVSIYDIQFFSLNFVEDWKKAESKYIRTSMVFNTYESISQFLQERNSFAKSALSNENIVVDSFDSSKKNIVVIIGESFNRHHSSLYDYKQNTNPKLSSLGNLFVFDNVISPINATSNSFKNFLSFSSIDDDDDWSDKPLFPAVFKAAGYNVAFLSNQFIREVNMTTYDASCGFFNHPSIAPKLFSFRNIEKYKYDEDLLNYYQSSRSSIESDSLNLIIFHLYGQHVRYSSRFPENRTYFTKNDYDYRKELTDSQKQDVADYDNATLYNDSIVYEIMTMFDSSRSIVIYFADHGDEANDYRAHVGRSRNLDIVGAPGLHCQLDIPFLIHFSNSYAESRPEDVERVKSAIHKPFIIDDLPHVLMDLAGFDYSLFQPSRSLVNSSYNDTRKRIVRPLASSYINYDSVCSKYGKWNIGY